jgi:predicted PurR-regulated permease PerM
MSEPANNPVMGRRRPDWRFALTVGIGVAIGLLLAEVVQGILIRLYDLLVTMIVALFVSFAFEPAVQWLDERGVRRGLGTGLVFLAGLLLFAGFVAAMSPLLVGQATTLVQQGPSLLGDLADQARNLPGEAGQSLATWLEEQRTTLPRRLPEIAPRVFGGALGFGQTLLGSLLQALTAALVSFYLVADGPRFRRVLSSRMQPDNQRDFLDVWELAVSKTGGYLYSRVLTAVASAIFHIAAFSVIGLPYAAALGVWVGLVSSVIPVIGTYLAGALPLIIALSSSPRDAIWVLVAIVVYQQVENYFVAPRITAHTLSLHPAIAFVSVLAGGALLGPIGALLALPATAIAAALASAYGERHEVVEHGLTTQRTSGKPPPGVTEGGPTDPRPDA